MEKKSFYAKYSTLILLLTVVATPLACWGALKAVKSNKNDVSDWLPKNYQETVELNWFRKHFVADQFVLISWDGCVLGEDPSGSEDDPRIAALADELLKVELPPEFHSEDRQCFKSVTTARKVLGELTAEPTSLTRKEAVNRLKGALIGPDGRQTCLIATLSQPASKNLKASIGRPMRRLLRPSPPPTPLFQALAAAKISEEEVRLGGPPVDNVAIDEEGERTLVRLAGLSGLLGISLAYWSLRSIRMTAIVFFCGIISAALALAMVPLTGSSMDAVLMSMPALVYVLAVSGSIHIINYYRQAAKDEHTLAHAVEHAVIHAWRPAILTSVTSAIGLASLLSSEIIPIAKFGGYSALGVISMLAVLFLVLPAAMKKWPWLPPELRMRGERIEERHTEAVVGPTIGDAFWTRFGTFIRRHHAAVLSACMLVIIGLCVGLPRVTTSIDLLKLFSSDARLLQDYRWFEENLGRIVPMELVIRFPKGSQQEFAPPGQAPGQLVDRHTFVERLNLVWQVQHSITRELGPPTDEFPNAEDLVGSTMSATTFAPQIGGKGSSLADQAVRNVTNANLVLSREDFERSGYLRVEESNGDELWRVSVRVAAFHGLDQGELVRKVQAAVEPVLTARQASVLALHALAQRRDGRANGARVLVWRPENHPEIAAQVKEFLASKNVQASSVSRSLNEVSDPQLAEFLKPFDGVVMGPGFSDSDFERIRLAGAPLLATFESAHARPGMDVVRGPAEVNVVYTGVIPVVYKAQRALLDSLIQSTWWSFATIMPLMMWVCRGIAAGAVVMIPNTLPVLVVFGGMGWLGIPVDIGSMMAASIALGVAVDDTIHFLAWYRDDLKALGDRHEAVLASYRRSATATLQAGLINGLGLSVFATSSFTPTQRFGWLMLTILVAGIVAELIMLPSLMFGPIGKVFSLRMPRRTKPPLPAAGRLDSALSPLDHHRVLSEHGAGAKA